MSSASAKNKKYEKASYNRRLVRDSIEGSPTIKRAGELYLPMPSGFIYTGNATPSITFNNSKDQDRTSLINAPWSHSNPAYTSYCQRARYPELTVVARNSLIGIAVSREPAIELPESIAYLEERAGKDGESLVSVFASLVAEVLTVGNVFPMLDVNPDTNEFFIEIVCAEELIDWTDARMGNTVDYANISRKVEVRDPTDKFQVTEEQMNFIYSIGTETNTAVMQGYKNESPDEDYPLTELGVQGTTFPKIPIFPIGSVKNSCNPQPAPLAGLAEICLSIYRKDADLSNSQYMSCNPNLIITGVDTSDPDQSYGDENLDNAVTDGAGGIPMLVGAQVAMMFSSPDTKVEYTQTDTSALDHMKEAIKQLFEEASIYSMSIIGKDKSGVESEATTRLRQTFQSATLINIIKNVGEQLGNLLKYAAELKGSSPESVVFQENTDFSDKAISADMARTILQIFMARGLSLETMLQKFKDSGLLGDEFDVNAEIQRISDMEPVA